MVHNRACFLVIQHEGDDGSVGVRVHGIVAMTCDYRLVCSTQLVVNPCEKPIKPKNQLQ
jgi:hypothetical protein